MDRGARDRWRFGKVGRKSREQIEASAVSLFRWLETVLLFQEHGVTMVSPALANAVVRPGGIVSGQPIKDLHGSFCQQFSFFGLAGTHQHAGQTVQVVSQLTLRPV